MPASGTRSVPFSQASVQYVLCATPWPRRRPVTRNARWRLRAANHKIIADSSEGYAKEADCLAGIKLVKGSANAPVYKV